MISNPTQTRLIWAGIWCLFIVPEKLLSNQFIYRKLDLLAFTGKLACRRLFPHIEAFIRPRKPFHRYLPRSPPGLRGTVVARAGGRASTGVHDDVFKWKHFLRYWPFVWGIHRSPENSPRKGQWCGALMFSLIGAWMNDWVNNREGGDLRYHRAHHDVIVM